MASQTLGLSSWLAFYSRPAATPLGLTEFPREENAGEALGALWMQEVRMGQVGGFNVLFIAGFGPIVRKATASRRLYR